MLWEKKLSKEKCFVLLQIHYSWPEKTAFTLLSVIQYSLGYMQRPRVAFNEVQWIFFISYVFITSVFIGISHFIKWKHFSHFKSFQRHFSHKLNLYLKKCLKHCNNFHLRRKYVENYWPKLRHEYAIKILTRSTSDFVLSLLFVDPLTLLLILWKRHDVNYKRFTANEMNLKQNRTNKI